MFSLRMLSLVCLLSAAAPAAAQQVTFNGHLEDRMALLVIDGVPRALATGQAIKGVKLLAVNSDTAKVDIEGRQVVLRLGAAPVRIGTAVKDGAGTEVILTAGTGGHFISGGSINGQAVQFLVDTGATSIAMSQTDADRIGVQYRNAQRGMAATANGPVPIHRVMLNSVRLGDVEVYNVEAVVMPAQMTHVLLGNSFLTRFQMKRENDRMTLTKRL